MTRFSLVSLLGLALLLPISSAMAADVTWSYTDCVNTDGVPAKADKSRLLITYGALSQTSYPISVEWQTDLLGGYDEMSKTDGQGVKTMVQDPTPVSATWNFSGQAIYSPKTTTLTLSTAAYPMIGKKQEQSSVAGQITYIETRGQASAPRERSVHLTQTFNSADGTSEVWVSVYSAEGMSRTEINIDPKGGVSTEVARRCGPASTEASN